MAQRILIGVDSSETAFRAAEKAASLAAAFGAELHVLSSFTVNLTQAVKHDQPEAYHRVESLYANNAVRTADAVVEALRVHHQDLEIISKAREGTPAHALLNEAEQIDADVIVVGNKRVQGPTRFLGSIARTIAAEAHCDLYLVNTRER